MQQRTLPPDFEAEYRFLSGEEGGRTIGPPYQGYRSAILYDGDGEKDPRHMICLEFLDADGGVLPIGVRAPSEGRARFCIIDGKRRQELHRHRLHVGTKFHMMEGPKMVAVGTVTAILALHENAQGDA